MSNIILQPIPLINGTIKLPGSKSISNRVLLLAALSNGVTTLKNLLYSDDTYYMLNALKKLGIRFQFYHYKKDFKIIGKSGNFFTRNPVKLFLGNSGTAMRLLTAALCIGKNEVILTGTSRMKHRPIKNLVDALRQGGAKIDYLEKANYPPLYLKGGFSGGEVVVDGSVSSQFVTALIIASPLASKDTKIFIKNNLVSKPYIDITLSLVKIFGIKLEKKDDHSILIYGNQRYKSPGEYIIEGDASSASYFLAAAAIKGGSVKIIGIGKKSIQGDINFAHVLETMGATITWGDNFIICKRKTLNAIDMNLNNIPDSAMTVATMSLFAQGRTKIRGIHTWRIKETDRLYAMAVELRKTGANIQEGKDFIYIDPPNKIKFTEIKTYNDHRIAMCFSLLALSNTPVIIHNPECIRKTFPDYFKELACLDASKFY